MQEPSDADDLTEEEWAELERMTAPEGSEPAVSTEPTPAVTNSGPAPATQQPPVAEEPVVVESVVVEPVVAEESVGTAGAEELVVEEPTAEETAVEETALQETAVEGTALEETAVEETALEETAVAEESVVVEPEEPAAAAEDQSEADGSDRLAMPLPRVIAVANQKGGVGKTTTTVNIAACLAEQGYRTLLVDLDPQANASTGLGLEPRELDHSIYHVMLHDEDADSCIEPTEVKNLFVLPSSLDLAGAEIELVAVMSREHRLRLAIESVIDDYDYVLIDCPPSLGLLTINALTAAKEVLVPIQCEYYALEGLGQLMRNVELVKANLNPALQISHIVLVMFDPRTKLAGQVVDEVRGHFGATVCENVIPRTVRLSEAPSFGQPITTFDTASRGAAAYRAVSQEVLGGQA